MYLETWIRADLQKMPEVSRMGLMFTGDSLANKIGVLLTSGGDAVNITGTVSGQIIRADGETLTVSGSKEGNAGWIILPEDAYAVQGEITISISETNGEKKTTLGVCIGNVRRSATNAEGGV